MSQYVPFTSFFPIFFGGEVTIETMQMTSNAQASEEQRTPKWRIAARVNGPGHIFLCQWRLFILKTKTNACISDVLTISSYRLPTVAIRCYVIYLVVTNHYFTLSFPSFSFSWTFDATVTLCLLLNTASENLNWMLRYLPWVVVSFVFSKPSEMTV